MNEDYSSINPQSNKKTILRVDGGMSASNYTMQFLADILSVSIDRPEILETTALGVAWLAGQKTGFYPKKDEFAKNWKVDTNFQASMAEEKRKAL